MRTSVFARYLFRRLGLAVLLVFAASSLSFVLSHVAPGDALTALHASGVPPETIERERERLGLDQPLALQYQRWLVRTLQLDLGRSTRYGRPVADMLGDGMRNTALLAAVALVVATLVGVWLGSVSGSREGGALQLAIGATSVAALSVPPLLASLLLAFLAARTGWFPVGGMSSPGVEAMTWSARLVDIAWHLTLPSLAIALPLAATIERLQSQSMAAALRQPYVRAAIARGLPWRRVVWRYALPVALRPVLGVYGVIVGGVFSGSFIVEIVSAWPGLGRLMYEGLVSRDLYLVAGCALAGSGCLAVGMLMSDLALFALDPRVRDTR